MDGFSGILNGPIYNPAASPGMASGTASTLHPEEAALHKALDDNWYDADQRAVLADWYDEHQLVVPCMACIIAHTNTIASTTTTKGKKPPLMKPNPKCRECGGNGTVISPLHERLAAGYRAMAALRLSPDKVAADSWQWHDNFPGEGFVPVEWFGALRQAISAIRGDDARFKTRKMADDALAGCWYILEPAVQGRLLKTAYHQVGLNGLRIDAGLTSPGFARDTEPVAPDHPLPPEYQRELDKWNSIPRRD